MKLLPLLVTFACLALVVRVRAQEDFYRIYQYETPLAGWVEPALWTTDIADSDLTTQAFGRDQPRDGLWAHSVEAELGVTDQLSAAAYADFEDPDNGPTRYTGARGELRYRFGQPHDHFVDTAIEAEYYLPRHAFSDTQELELRAIVQKDVEDFRFVLNPALTFPTSGEEAGHWPDAEIDLGAYYRRSRHVQPGVEFYEDLNKISSLRHERLVVMPTADILIGRHLIWQLGVGRGLSGETDRWMVKSIVSVEFDAIRPSRWFAHEH